MDGTHPLEPATAKPTATRKWFKVIRIAPKRQHDSCRRRLGTEPSRRRARRRVDAAFRDGRDGSHRSRKEVKLLRASPAVRGKQNDVRVKLTNDFRSTPRVFVHWPSELADASQEKHEAAADVMRAIIAAQVADRRPTKGDNTLADPRLQGATFF